MIIMIILVKAHTLTHTLSTKNLNNPNFFWGKTKNKVNYTNK